MFFSFFFPLFVEIDRKQQKGWWAVGWGQGSEMMVCTVKRAKNAKQFLTTVRVPPTLNKEEGKGGGGRKAEDRQ